MIRVTAKLIKAWTKVQVWKIRRKVDKWKNRTKK